MTARERLFAKAKPDKSGCLLWCASVDSRGYGHLGVDGKTVRAHRLAWEMEHGPIPDGQHVLHKCDVRTCINVDHLFLGTHAENMRDMFRKGRRPAPRGERNGSAKIDSAVAAAIRGDKRIYREVALSFGVSPTQVGRIKRGESWGASA